MSNLEQAAAAAVASYERCGNDWDGFCRRMELLGKALAAHKEQAEPVTIPGAIAMAEAVSEWWDSSYSRAMPKRAEALKQAETDDASGNPSY